MLYPQNGDRVVTKDSVTSFYAMYKYNSEVTEDVQNSLFVFYSLFVCF